MFCLLYTWFSGKHKTSCCPKVVRDRTDVVGLELYVGDSLKNVGVFWKTSEILWKTLEIFWKTLEILWKTLEIFWKTLEFFGKLSEKTIRTWEIFSYERESQKNRLKRVESETPSRAWRAHALQRFLFFHFHNLHITDDFGRKIAWKCSPKRNGDVRKLTPYFAGRWWRLWKQKIKFAGEGARDARTRETRAYFSSSDEQKW